jgi:hypothetical protein
MSSVMRPSGPLPPRIYWVRRLFALVMLVVIISILWWCVQKVTGSADDSQPPVEASDTQDPDSSAEDPAEEPATTGGETPSQGTDEPSDPGSTSSANAGDRQDNNKPGRKNKKKKAPLLAPTGGCDVADVALAIEVSDVKQGRANPISLLMTGPQGTACTQAITPSTLVLRITSGDDVVWNSDDCPDKLLASEVVVRADPPGSYEFNWNGRRSTGSCAGVGAFAKPGGYWVEAALIGADSHKAFFDVLDS